MVDSHAWWILTYGNERCWIVNKVTMAAEIDYKGTCQKYPRGQCDHGELQFMRIGEDTSEFIADQ